MNRLHFILHHRRLPLFWLVAVLGLAIPWLLPTQLPLVLSGVEADGFNPLGFSKVHQTCTLTHIHDGDTLRATCAGKTVKVRLYCIDAPELSQRPWGQQSRDHLRAITPQRFRLIEHDRDRYGRTVAELIDPASGRSINRQMVEQGQAAVYRRYCPEAGYRQAEQEARRQGLGIWRQAGDWQRPWDWR